MPTEKKKRKTPQGYTEEIATRLLQFIALGVDKESACNAVNIDPSTYYNWLKEYPAFGIRAREAEHQREGRYLARLENIITDPKTDARTRLSAITWILEKTFPKKYGARASLEITKTDTDVKKLTDLELAAAVKMAIKELDCNPRT